jgi:subtilisin family serine protease
MSCQSFARAGLRHAPPQYDKTLSWVSPNRLYVRYRAAAAARIAQSVDGAAGAVLGVDIGPIQGGFGHRAITLPAGSNLATVTATLRRNPDVAEVAPVHLRRVMAASEPDAVDDPLSDNQDQWYIYIDNADPGAWEINTGSTNVSLAVIDSGVDETNADFSSKLSYQESIVNGVTSTAGGAAQDTNGHGTNVAGIADAQANNGFGFAGVGYNTKLQAYKIFPNTTSSDCNPSADTADEVTAINTAVANGASVINLSLGAPNSSGPDSAEQSAIDNALAHNVSVVAAAGNDDASAPDYPAAYAGVIAVGASSAVDGNPSSTPPYTSITGEAIASYSNSGPTLVAPGGDPTSDTDEDLLHWIENYSTTTDGYPPDECQLFNPGGGNVCAELFAGTSQATASVSGTVALMEAEHGGSRSLTPSQIVTILTKTTDVLPGGISSARQGAGRVDVAKAVAGSAP